jgi:hypothetical protein
VQILKHAPTATLALAAAIGCWQPAAAQQPPQEHLGAVHAVGRFFGVGWNAGNFAQPAPNHWSQGHWSSGHAHPGHSAQGACAHGGCGHSVLPTPAQFSAPPMQPTPYFGLEGHAWEPSWGTGGGEVPTLAPVPLPKYGEPAPGGARSGAEEVPSTSRGTLPPPAGKPGSVQEPERSPSDARPTAPGKAGSLELDTLSREPTGTREPAGVRSQAPPTSPTVPAPPKPGLPSPAAPMPVQPAPAAAAFRTGAVAAAEDDSLAYLRMQPSLRLSAGNRR